MKTQTTGFRNISRRDFVRRALVTGSLLSLGNPFTKKMFAAPENHAIRRFHISLQAEAWEAHPELINTMKNAGITDVWMGSFLQGRWYHTPEELKASAAFLKRNGLNAHVLTVPLGHPGNALDPSDTSWSESKKSWKNACTYDGKLYSGTSIHSPVVEENVAAVKALAQAGFDKLFLDDDFRLARYPGQIGGCFCDDCKKDFLEKTGYPPAEWDLLIEAVANRNPTKMLHSWLDYNCDKEYRMFTALQNAAPEMTVGIMVMYLGSEKAGIALDKYGNVPFRVGELMFGDKSFGRVKGKTDELFSALFHRRFARPELAFSETTTYPENALSAKNMAAKLTISLLSDVRNTMFMSGIKAFPVSYWATLGPAMKKSAALHKEIAGFKPAGPFKHFWGWDSRLIGTDKPFSLFLASGIPFEVVDDIPKDGWVFLSDEDAKAVKEGRLQPGKGNLMVRKSAGLQHDRFTLLDETPEDIFAFKKRIIPTLKNIPYVDGNTPVVFAWYPKAQKALLWNVNEENQTFTVKMNGRTIRKISVRGLDVELIPVA